MEYSFGPRKLDNLDRVVAAMVKKHISFPDIVQVAVGLVQHDLGGLLHQDEAYVSEDKLRAVFGSVGVDAWKASRPKANVMDSLLGSAGPYIKTNPRTPTNAGSSGTLG